MNRLGVSIIVTALMASACSRKHAGTFVVGGLATTSAGAYLFAGSVESERETQLPLVGVAMITIGVLMFLGGVVGAASPEEPPKLGPPKPPELPSPPAHTAEESRRARRVAVFMAEHGRCAEVQQLSVRLAALDAEFHAAHFVTDRTIAKCLAR